MRSKLLSLLENGSELDLSGTEGYAAIIGSSPSKGARSPALWNAGFEALAISAVMHPMDVAPPDLDAVVKALGADERFMGGAVAVPFKVDIVPLLDAVEPDAQIIGAVNCIYREGERLIGANTDGEAGLRSLEGRIPTGMCGATVLLMGTGGAGRAVATYVAGALGAGGRLVLANRTLRKAEDLVERLADRTAVSTCAFPPDKTALEQCDILINCTTVGFEHPVDEGTDERVHLLRPYTPLALVDSGAGIAPGPDVERRWMEKAATSVEKNLTVSLRRLTRLPTEAVVFDIIYQPRQTMLLVLAELHGLQTVNGEQMNLDQAVLAFRRAAPTAAGVAEIRSIMARATS